MNQNFSFDILLLLNACQFHSILPKSIFSSFLYICYSLHSLYCLYIEISVVLQRLVPFFLKLKNSVVSKLLVIEFTGGFSPCEFSGVVFGFEVTMAFRSTKPEGFTIISDKHNSVSRIDWS